VPAAHACLEHREPGQLVVLSARRSCARSQLAGSGWSAASAFDFPAGWGKSATLHGCSGQSATALRCALAGGAAAVALELTPLAGAAEAPQAAGGAIALRLSVEQMQHLAVTLRDALHAAEREAAPA
jgi:hypothetical protein